MFTSQCLRHSEHVRGLTFHTQLLPLYGREVPSGPWYGIDVGMPVQYARGTCRIAYSRDVPTV